MNPMTALYLAQIAAGLIEIWRHAENKPADWQPAPSDWDRLLRNNEKTAEDYKREARQALSDPIPPGIPEM